MAKEKTAQSYERELKRMIKERTGQDMELWLMPQVRAAASNMVMLDRVHAELMKTNELTTLLPGSMGQIKKEVNPLLAHYDKMQRTLLMQLEALGLNYNTQPKKVTENTKQGGEEADKLVAVLNDIK